MTTPRGWIPLLLVLLSGCGSAARVVRLDTGQREPLVYTPRSDAEPVELGGEEFEEAVRMLGRDAPVSTRPREDALRLFEDSLRPRA